MNKIFEDPFEPRWQELKHAPDFGSLQWAARFDALEEEQRAAKRAARRSGGVSALRLLADVLENPGTAIGARGYTVDGLRKVAGRAFADAFWALRKSQRAVKGGSDGK